MKNTLSILAFASGVAANGFLNANPFTCPGNSNDKCNSQQSSGFDWGSLSIGQSGGFSYGGFDFNGWSCEAASFPKKRYERRGSGKAISGSCHPEPENCPSFGCGAGSDVESFSIATIEVSVEFDCDLEFHYSMPDGSDCKQRSPCSSKGSVISNDQCGGAKSVTVVFPSQTGKPKPSCSVTIPTISFSCHTPTTTAKTTTTTAKTTTTTKATTTTTSAAGKTTTTTSAAGKTTTTTVATTTTTSAAGKTTTTTVATTTTSAAGAGSSSTTTAGTTTTSAAGAGSSTTTAATSTTTAAGESSTTPCSSVSPTTTAMTTMTTSSAAGVTTSPSTSTTSSSGPSNTGSCPSVVPQCLNTWLFSVSCTDNTDTACYCPNTIFVENIFSCIYAWGETDSVVSEAILYFQGICAPYAPGNPCIATGANTITSYLTATATETVSAVGAGSTAYTTVTVAATTVVPCTNEAGSTITGSSTTLTVQTTLTVPAVTLTETAGAGAATGAATTVGGAPKPAGTATATQSGPFVTVNGGGRVTAGLGMLGAAVIAVVAAL